LTKYEDEKRVYTISGYTWPLDLEQPEDEDIYFCGRISSWGWGTWKDRWKDFALDYTLAKEIKRKTQGAQYLSLWGNDLEDMLVGNIRGNVDSWAVFWALKVIEKRGLCINPYKSLISQIGYDGLGRHCVEQKDKSENFALVRMENVRFPQNIKILPEVENAFMQKCLFGSMKLNVIAKEDKENVVVYGLGKFYKQHEQELLSRYNIVAFIDKEKQGHYLGNEIIFVNDIHRFTYDKIIIMIYDISVCIEVAYNLLELDVFPDKIVIGHEVVDNHMGFWYMISQGSLWQNILLVLSRLAEKNKLQK